MALCFAMKRLTVEPKEDDFDALVVRLTENGFSPVIKRAKQAVHEMLGLDLLPQTRPNAKKGRLAFGLQLGQVLKGEVFVRPEARSAFYLKIERGVEDSSESEPAGITRTRTRLYLEAGMIGDISDAPHLEAFCDCLLPEIRRVRSEDGDDCTFWSIRWSNKSFDKLVSDPGAKSSKVTNDERHLAAALHNKAVRSVLTTVKAAGGMLAKDIAGSSGTSNDQIVKELVEKGFLERELVVICRKTSQQINRLKSRVVLDEIDRHGVRCSCGRRLSEERVEELLTPSDNARKLLDGSRWMAASLVECLEGLGIPESRLTVGFQEGSEEVDAFLDVDGKLVMVELKDKEFSLGHAYRVSGRIGIYKPSHAVIVSTELVAADVKDYFGKIEPKAKVWYVDGLEKMGPQLEVMIDEIRASRALELLKEFDSLASLNLNVPELVAAKLGIFVPETEESTDFKMPSGVWGE
jgi:hypothetical protein